MNEILKGQRHLPEAEVSDFLSYGEKAFRNEVQQAYAARKFDIRQYTLRRECRQPERRCA